MGRCPNEQQCVECKEPLIHKGSRGAHESSSQFGQIVHDYLPHVFTWIDIDGALYRREIRLLRIFEHKSPGQRREYSQRELLKLLSRTIEHIKNCDQAKLEFQLHERSGVFLIEGSPQQGRPGPSRIIPLHDEKKSLLIEDESKMLLWLALLDEEKHKKHVREKLARQATTADGARKAPMAVSYTEIPGF